MSKLVCWVDIPANDLDRAMKFYSKVLSIDLFLIDSEKESMACFPNGEGAISKSEGFKPSINGSIVSFAVSGDLETALSIAKTEGGKLLKGKTKIEAEGMGYFALIADTEGNQIGLYSNS